MIDAPKDISDDILDLVNDEINKFEENDLEPQTLEDVSYYTTV